MMLQADFGQATQAAVTAAWTTGAGLVWQQAAALAVLISIFLVALAYMVSVILDLPEAKRWARGEFLQAMASAMLVFGLIAFTGLISTGMANITRELAANNPVLSAIPPGVIQPDNPFSLTHFYLNSTLKCIRLYYVKALRIALLVDTMASVTLSSYGVHTVTGWPFSYPSNMAHQITQLSTWLLIANYFQRQLLNFVADTMFTIFLPLGVVLRVLPYTRGAGAFLMGLAIGMYLVYPFSYALILSVGAQHDLLSCVEYNVEALREQCATQEGIAQLSFIWKVKNTGIIAYLTTVGRLIPFMFMEAYIYPLMALTITFTAVKQLSDFLGANVAEIAQGLVRLI
ncbi:MAG: hypothetical protein QXG98_00460 [Candidatus Micrarchaeia archaeon]